MERSDHLTLSLICLAVVAVLGVTAWLFLYDKGYDFVVEAPCDPLTETCFYRECSDLSNTGDCPPNGLEDYKIFVLRASDFSKCSDNSCLNECRSGTISCAEIVCGENEEDECSIAPEVIEIEPAEVEIIEEEADVTDEV